MTAVLAENAALLLGAVSISAVMFAVLWLLHWVLRNAGVVDLGWTAGVGLFAVAAAWTGEGWEPRRLLVGAMGAAWAVRLCTFILRDRIIPGEEDGRYKRLRARWGERASWFFFPFFVGQSLLVALFVLPFLPAAARGAPGWTIADAAGLLIWVAAMVGETAADRQLARHRADPANRGRTCRAGLWRYSRHPNYFFEWLHWWAYAALAVGSAAWPLGLIGPAAMLLFLFKLTGIPHVEAQALASRGDDYRQYQKTTSMFIPWRPKERRDES